MATRSVGETYVVMEVVRAQGSQVWHLAVIGEPQIAGCGAKLKEVAERGSRVPAGAKVCRNCQRKLESALGGRYEIVG